MKHSHLRPQIRSTLRVRERTRDQLKRRDRSPSYEVAADREATILCHGEHAPASTPRDDEISGYGSHAHWRHTRRPTRR